MANNRSAKAFSREWLACVADGLVVAAAVALPWSTSATTIFVVLWLIALIPTAVWPDIRREILTLPGGLPVLLFVFGLAGMLWADVSLLERWKGLDSFFKLLAIPLLFAQFRRSNCGHWVFAGYVLSCTVLLAATAFVMASEPLAARLLHFDNVMVKNAPTQSGEFVTCIFGLLFLAIDEARRRRWLWLLGTAVIIVAMLVNTLYVATGRTALVVAVVLLAVLALKKLEPKGMAVVFGGALLIVLFAWMSSPLLRYRMTAIWTETQRYEATGERTSSGERIEFWKKSIEFIRESPFIGHGTGSIHSLFEKAAAGQTGTAAVAASNPHNQTFGVAIQLGVLGAAVLWAMWMAHLLMFRGAGLAEWIGLVIVVQNIVGSMFNSHLFDFVQGWAYVIGVGVAGGISLKAGAKNEASQAMAQPQ